MENEKKNKIDWKNPDEVRAYKRERSRIYNERHKEARKAATAKWQAENKDKIAANFQKYYEENREKHLEYMRQYHEANKEKMREQARERYQRNKLKQTVDNEEQQ